MLNYLDDYPLLLPYRYFNRQACYTKAFLITNVPPDSQYMNIDREADRPFTAASTVSSAFGTMVGSPNTQRGGLPERHLLDKGH